MNKKEYLKNKPFDEIDALQMQDYVEQLVKDYMKYINSVGVLSGLNLTNTSLLNFSLATGVLLDNSYNLININTTQTFTLSNGHATLPRIDLVSARYTTVKTDNVDTANKYGRGTSYVYSKNISDSFQIIVTPGTPAASPTEPTPIAGDIPLYAIRVNALATTPASTTDKRVYATITNIDNSITNAKLATDIKVGSLASLTTSVKTSVVAAINEIQSALAGKINTTDKGAVNGIASLDGTGKVPTAQIPSLSYVPTTEKGSNNGVATLDGTGKVPASQLSVSNPPDGTTSVKGIVQLTDSVSSTSTTTAVTPNSVKTVNDTLTNHSADAVKHITSTERTNWNAKIDSSQINVANGVAPLDSNSNVPFENTNNLINASVTLYAYNNLGGAF